jgi:hypothetical protein
MGHYLVVTTANADVKPDAPRAPSAAAFSPRSRIGQLNIHP